MSASIIQVAEEYVKWDPNEESRKVVADLLQQGKTAELQAILGSRLVFGTAGLRGPMGAGYNRMNELVVLQTTQGLIKYMEGLDSSVKEKVAVDCFIDRYSQPLYRVLLLVTTIVVLVRCLPRALLESVLLFCSVKDTR